MPSFAAVAALGAMLIPLWPSLASPTSNRSSSSGARTPPGWRWEVSPGRIPGAGAYRVALPPELRTILTKGVNSYVSEYWSKSLKLILDFGAYGSSGVEECQQHSSSCATGTTIIGGVMAIRTSYYEKDPDGDLPYRLSYYIPFGAQPPSPAVARWRISLKIWVECETRAACNLADRIVKTIEVIRDR